VRRESRAVLTLSLSALTVATDTRDDLDSRLGPAANSATRCASSCHVARPSPSRTAPSSPHASSSAALAPRAPARAAAAGAATLVRGCRPKRRSAWTTSKYAPPRPTQCKPSPLHSCTLLTWVTHPVHTLSTALVHSSHGGACALCAAAGTPRAGRRRTADAAAAASSLGAASGVGL
jgi:hypothetical protein